MKAANEMDGAVGFTQCPILKDETFTYEFNISDDQDGTFWYHAHSQLQRADGLYGGLIVHRPAAYEVEFSSKNYGYNQEVLLLVGDWYHRSADEIMQWYLSARSFGNEVFGEPLYSSHLWVNDSELACTRLSPHQWCREVRLLHGSTRQTTGLQASVNSKPLLYRFQAC